MTDLKWLKFLSCLHSDILHAKFILSPLARELWQFQGSYPDKTVKSKKGHYSLVLFLQPEETFT